MIKIKMTGKAGTIEIESSAQMMCDINGLPKVVDRITKYDVEYMYREMAKTDGIEEDVPNVTEEE